MQSLRLTSFLSPAKCIRLSTLQPTQAGSTIQMVLFTTMEPITYIISTIPSVSKLEQYELGTCHQYRPAPLDGFLLPCFRMKREPSFSGCGLTNEQEGDEIQAAADSNLYRSLPKDALLFFYTAAGGSMTAPVAREKTTPAHSIQHHRSWSHSAEASGSSCSVSQNRQP